MPRGRRTKLTPELQRDFCKVLEAGGTYEMAAARVGVSTTSVYNWLKWGRERDSGVYVDFLGAASEATKICGLTWLAMIQKLASQKGDWKAYAWLLERRFPHDFARAADRPDDTTEARKEAETLAVKLLESLKAEAVG